MRDRVRKILAALLGVIAGIYLLNPSAGLFELLPDHFPLLGNLDEASAMALLLMALRVWGFDVTAWLLPSQRQPRA